MRGQVVALKRLERPLPSFVERTTSPLPAPVIIVDPRQRVAMIRGLFGLNIGLWVAIGYAVMRLI